MCHDTSKSSGYLKITMPQPNNNLPSPHYAASQLPLMPLLCEVDSRLSGLALAGSGSIAELECLRGEPTAAATETVLSLEGETSAGMLLLLLC